MRQSHSRDGLESVDRAEARRWIPGGRSHGPRAIIAPESLHRKVFDQAIWAQVVWLVADNLRRAMRSRIERVHASLNRITAGKGERSAQVPITLGWSGHSVPLRVPGHSVAATLRR